MITEKYSYTIEVIKSLKLAQEIGAEYKNSYYSGVHLLKAILNPDFSLREDLINYEIDVDALENWTDLEIRRTVKSKEFYSCEASYEIHRILLEAQLISDKKFKTRLISLWCLLYALFTEDIAFSRTQIATLPTSLLDFFKT